MLVFEVILSVVNPLGLGLFFADPIPPQSGLWKKEIHELIFHFSYGLVCPPILVAFSHLF